MLRFSPGLTRWQKGERGREEGQGRWWCFSNEDDFMTWYTVRMLHLWNETMKMIVWHDKPLQVPEDLQKLKKTLSDKTKRKIAENNRKFSICKLCRWDLASFFLFVQFPASNAEASEVWWITCTATTATTSLGSVPTAPPRLHSSRPCTGEDCGLWSNIFFPGKQSK